MQRASCTIDLVGESVFFLVLCAMFLTMQRLSVHIPRQHYQQHTLEANKLRTRASGEPSDPYERRLYYGTDTLDIYGGVRQ
jgi:hypothetical protein